MNKISNYFRESYKELTEKVTWPTWAQLQQSTLIVLICNRINYGCGLADGFRKQSIAETDLFILQLKNKN